MSKGLNVINAVTAAHPGGVKTAGIAGASSAGFGLIIDTESLSVWMQIAADLGVFLGGVAAIISIIWSVAKGRGRNNSDR